MLSKKDEHPSFVLNTFFYLGKLDFDLDFNYSENKKHEKCKL